MIKNTGGQIIGFTQLGGMNECTLAQVESKGCTDDESVEHPPIADHIIWFSLFAACSLSICTFPYP